MNLINNKTLVRVNDNAPITWGDFKAANGEGFCTADLAEMVQELESQGYTMRGGGSAELVRISLTSQIRVQLERLGFSEVHTGGGCYAMVKDLSGGLYLQVTDGEAGLPDDVCGVAMGLYCETHSEEIMMQTYANGAALAATLSTV